MIVLACNTTAPWAPAPDTQSAPAQTLPVIFTWSLGCAQQSALPGTPRAGTSPQGCVCSPHGRAGQPGRRGAAGQLCCDPRGEAATLEHVSAMTHHAAPLPGLRGAGKVPLSSHGTWLPCTAAQQVPSPAATGPGAGSSVPLRPEGEGAELPATTLPSATAACAPPSAPAFLTWNGVFAGIANFIKH